MSNLVTTWKEQAAEKYGSISAGVRQINLITNSQMVLSSIYDMEKGRRNVPPSVSFFMMNEVLLDEVKAAKIGYTKATLQVDLKQLRNRITLPLREKSKVKLT